jgi:hypothetical protein
MSGHQRDGIWHRYIGIGQYDKRFSCMFYDTCYQKSVHWLDTKIEQPIPRGTPHSKLCEICFGLKERIQLEIERLKENETPETL